MQTLLKYLKVVTEKELAPGVIAVIQTSGERINFHPHLHFLMTEGGTDKEGKFHKVAKFDESLIAEFFSWEVFSLLLREELISLELVRKVLRWRYSGFNVHSKVRATSNIYLEVYITFGLFKNISTFSGKSTYASFRAWRREPPFFLISLVILCN